MQAMFGRAYYHTALTITAEYNIYTVHSKISGKQKGLTVYNTVFYNSMHVLNEVTAAVIFILFYFFQISVSRLMDDIYVVMYILNMTPTVSVSSI